MGRKEGSRKPWRTAGPRRPLTLVYLISRLGVGDGKRCRDAMRAAGSAFTSPGISILLEVMVAGRGLARPRRGLCGLCARSAGRGRARLYIGRCQAGALLIGREGRSAGGWSILPRTPGRSPDLHKARRPRRAVRSLGAHGQVRPATQAHAHPAAAAGLDGQSGNPRRGRAGLGDPDRPRSGSGGGGGGRTLADVGHGSWPQKQSGRGLTRSQRRKLPGRGRRLLGRQASPAADGERQGRLPPTSRGTPNTRSPSLPETRGAPSALLPRAGGPAHTHSAQWSPRCAAAAGSGTGSNECESFAPHSKLRIPARRPSPGFSRPGAALCRLGPPRAVRAAPQDAGRWSL